MMKMKKITAILLAGIASQNAYAIDENGVDVEESMFTQFGRFDAGNGSCSGTFIGKNWFLTAAHCLDVTDIENTSYVQLNSGRKIIGKTKHQILIDENDPYSATHDIALIELEESPNIEQMSFLSPTPLDFHDFVEIYGFAGRADLRKGRQQTWYNGSPKDKGDGLPDNSGPYDYPWIETINLAEGTTQGGDSGAAWVKDGAIVGVHMGFSTYNYEHDWGSRFTKIAMPDVLDWITTTIDDWHFAPNQTVKGVGTITVQSLHVNPVVDSSYTEGDVTIDFANSTCTQQATIDPFDTCTYVVQSNGGKGKLFLSDESFVEINGEIWNPEPPPGGYEPIEAPQSSGGGSIPFQMIPLMLLFWGLRKK